MTGGLLRAAAVAIAIAAAIDPPLTISGRGRARIAVVTHDSASDANRRVVQTLADTLRTEYDIVRGADATAEAAVVVGAEYPEQPLPERQRVFTVTVPPADAQLNVRVSDVRAPRAVTPGTLVHLEVDVDGANVGGVTSTLIVRAGSASVEVGRATHAWTAPRERWRAAVDVTPLDAPPWRLRIHVSAAPGERVLADNAGDALVGAEEPVPVVVYEPRLSWAGTFVRRALERDSRFDVTAVAFPSRGSRFPALADRTRVVIVGGLDRLSADAAAAVSRFGRERGGAIVLVPASLADLQAVGRWLPIPAATEALLEQPARLSVDAPLPAIQATELLTFDQGPAMRALATNASKAPVIVVTPMGAGQLVVSGALDAWRFRANDRGAFDRFWQSAIAGAAASVRPPIDVAVTPPVVAPGTNADVIVRVRRSALGLDPDVQIPISAKLNGGDPVRLWPADEPDAFQGSFSAPSVAGANRVTVTASRGFAASADFIVASDARAARPPGAPLSLLAASRGGQDVSAGDIRSLARVLRERIAAPSVRVERRPMRSAWWLAPFVACLGGEWWIRRRNGRR